MSLLGFDAIGRLAVGQIPKSAVVSLAVSPASFAIAGQPVMFTTQEAVTPASVAVSGVDTPLVIKQAAPTPASYAVTGKTVTFSIEEAPDTGVFVVTGNPANTSSPSPAEPAAFTVTTHDVAVSRTGPDYEWGFQGGVGHFLYERERAKQLAAITRNPPPPIDRRTAPQLQPLARPYSAAAAPAVDLQAIQNQRMAAQAAAAQAQKKRRDEEALLLLAS